MKFIILSGAYINAGDFLIVDRTKKILQNIYSNCELIEYPRNISLDDKLNEINKSDALIIAGGPAYKTDMYPSTIKLVSNLDEIKTKILTIGVGWYGKDTTNECVYSYEFSDSSKKLLNKISLNTNLACRDWYSVKVLQNNGFLNTKMTGCPAWYNLDKVEQTTLRENINFEFKKICISDPANDINFSQCMKLINFIKNKFPNSQINFILHRNENNGKYDNLINFCNENKISIIDITGSVEKFSIYDDCDLHIGYRVHAHIYNLSNRNISILIEEDGRGTGVDEALGLETIKANNENGLRIYGASLLNKIIRGIYRVIFKHRNKYIIMQIDNYLKMLKANNYVQFDIAFKNMNLYYKIMQEHIRQTIGEEK